MTQGETRQLGIEFERRCQTIDPTMEYIGKMDTDDIYSFLNQFVVEYVKQAYQNKNKVEKGTPEYEKITWILDSCHKMLTYRDGNPSDSYIPIFNFVQTTQLPEEILQILNISISTKGIDYTGKIDLVTLQDGMNLRSSANQNFILKRPVAYFISDGDGGSQFRQLMLETGSLYTCVGGNTIEIVVIAVPDYFGPTDECKLPMMCFDDIVTGAVQLYFNHKAALTRSDNKNDKKTEES